MSRTKFLFSLTFPGLSLLSKKEFQEYNNDNIIHGLQTLRNGSVGYWRPIVFQGQNRVAYKFRRIDKKDVDVLTDNILTISDLARIWEFIEQHETE